MALANYVDLQASVQSYMERADLAAIVPDWILLAESTINGHLILQSAEQDSFSGVSLNYTIFDGQQEFNLNVSPFGRVNPKTGEYELSLKANDPTLIQFIEDFVSRL